MKVLNFTTVLIDTFVSFVKKSWGIVALQYCVSFCCTLMWISYIYTYIPLFIFLSVILLWSPSFLVSLPSLFSKNSWETYGHLRWLCLIPQPPFQTCLSFKQAKWKKQYFLKYKYNYQYSLMQQTLLTVNLSWQDLQTVLGGWRKKRTEEALRSTVCFPQKSEQLPGDNETYKSD